MESLIRAILGRTGEIAGDVDTLPLESSLHDAGLTSYGTVEVMVALEGALGVEFPDALLRRDTFASIGAILRAVERLQAGPVAAAREVAA